MAVKAIGQESQDPIFFKDAKAGVVGIGLHHDLEIVLILREAVGLANNLNALLTLDYVR